MNKKIVVRAEDNGKGFYPTKINKERNGLINMQQRTEDTGGKCRVISGIARRVTEYFRERSNDKMHVHSRTQAVAKYLSIQSS